MASSPGFTGGIMTGPIPQPQSSGLLGDLFKLLSGRPVQPPPVSALGQVPPVLAESTTPEPPLTSQQPSKPGWRDLLAPNVAMPVAGALLGNRGNAGNFGAAFDAMGPALQQNKTLNYLRQNNPELAKMVDSGLPISNAFEFLMEERQAQLAGPKAPSVETFYDESTGMPYKAQWGQNGWQRIGGTKGDEGFEITTADGTTIRQGAFGSKDRRNMADRITAGQDSSAAASQLKQTVQLLREANRNTGYSGPGAGIYGAADDAAEQFGVGDYLPGQAGARATMRKGGVDAALAMVGKTKGAISNAEMGLFMAAAPGMANTPQANEALFDIMEAIADRDIERQDQMENWRAQNGTLDGFEKAWGDYVSANPVILSDGQGGIALADSTGQLNKTGTGATWRVVP